MNVKQPPHNFTTLRDAILARYPRLSHRLQQIARFALEHPNDMALQTITMIASRIGVAPSAIIRFAKALDYRGFSDMQAVFRLPLRESFAGTPNERPRLSRIMPGGGMQPTTVAAVEEVVDTGIVSLQQLLHEVALKRLEQAVEMLLGRRVLYVVGQRYAFPVAAYLTYALTRLDYHVQLLDGVGGMLIEQATGISGDDILIAVSFSPYKLETAELAAHMAARGAAVIAITDSALDPIAGIATVCLEVHEQQVQDVPSLIAALCLVQALVIIASLRPGSPSRPEPYEDCLKNRK